MTELRRLVWRHKTARYLREKLRDRFTDEAEGMRSRMRQLCKAWDDAAIGSTPQGRMAREFDANILETIRYARATNFDSALLSIGTAAAQLHTIEEAALAWNTMDQLERELGELEHRLAGWQSTSVGDFRILLLRARTFYGQEKYQTARAIASEALDTLIRLMVAADEKETPPDDLVQRIRRLENMAGKLKTWDIAAEDSAQIQKSIEVIRGAIEMRQYELSRLLLTDLEAEKAQISTLIDLLHLRKKAGLLTFIHQTLISPGQDGQPDWAGAANRLIADSLEQTSDWLNHGAPVLSRRALSPGENT